MSKEGKVIKIDPIMFSIPEDTKKTKKKQPKSNKSNIKIKSNKQKKRDTLKKQSLLKMIRSHQEDKYKQLFEKQKKKKLKEDNNKSDEINFKDSFESSKMYLNSLLDDQKEQSMKPKNKTMKNNSYQSEVKEPLKIETKVEGVPLSIDLTNIGNNMNTNADNTSNIINLGANSTGVADNVDCLGNFSNNVLFNSSPKLEEVNLFEKSSLIPETNITIPDAPKYGILKNGSLPTYRNYFNKTRKNNEDTNLIRHNIMKEKMNKKNNYSEIYKKNKQKRTIRRSFTTGKSLKVPKISVLISNKKIRNNTSLKIVKTREKSIQEIKRELVKRGLIKVGTIAPNEVLRKMYETIELLCGDVQNYNSDTLLYNFMNDK